MRYKPVCPALPLVTFYKSILFINSRQNRTADETIIMGSDLDLKSFDKLSKAIMQQGMLYSDSSRQREDTKQCFKIFLELGEYLLSSISQELKEEELRAEKENNIELSAGDGGEPEPRDSHLPGGKYEQEENIKCGHPVTAPQNKPQLKMKREDRGLSFPCKECKFVAPTYIVLKGHERLNHMKENFKICIKCGFESDDQKEFSKHLKIVHPKKLKITQYRN